MLKKRWTATVNYRKLEGAGRKEPDVHHVEEVEELQEILERGPDWHLIKDVNIVYNR